MERARKKSDGKDRQREKRGQMTVEWYRAHYKGDNSKGYEHREAELALGARWRAAFDKLSGEF
jgi:hypothetical protein